MPVDLVFRACVRPGRPAVEDFFVFLVRMRVRQTGGYSVVLSSRDQGGGSLWLVVVVVVYGCGLQGRELGS